MKRRTVSVSKIQGERIYIQAERLGVTPGRIIEHVLDAAEAGVAPGPLPLGPTINIGAGVAPAIFDLLDDHVARHGGTTGELLDAAILRSIAALEASPPVNQFLCSLCTRALDQATRAILLTEAGVRVYICATCNNVHPRDGGPRFGGGRDDSEPDVITHHAPSGLGSGVVKSSLGQIKRTYRG